MDISASEFQSRYLEPGTFVIIDVRDELEFQTFNVGGYNFPLGSLQENLSELNCPKDGEIVVICQRGIRSNTAKILMNRHGFSRVRNLTGGLSALQRLTYKQNHSI